MKILIAVFISLFSLDASAQFYTKFFPHKKPRHFFLQKAYSASVLPNSSQLEYNTFFNNFSTDLGRSRYSIDAEEKSIMNNLKHSARYGPAAMRIEFDNLAYFYLRQNRFSEAKWYVLRSNAISRQQNNYTQIIGSLVVLADLKSNLGDYKQADEDLSEAKNIAATHSLLSDLLLIEEHIKQIKLHKEIGLKMENHYSDLL